MTAPNPTQGISPASGAEISEEERNMRISRVSLITSLLSLALAIAVLVCAFVLKNAQLMIPAVALVTAFLLQMLIAQGLVGKSATSRVFLVLVTNQVSLILFTIYISGTSLIIAGIILIYALMSSITLLKEDIADAVLPVSLMSAIFAGLLGTYPNVTQVSLPVFGYVLGALLAVLLVTLAGLLLAGLITPNLRIKITMAALCIVIIPLATLNVIDSTFLRNILLQHTEETLKESAQVVANRVDEYIKTTRVAIASITISNVFSDYIELPIGQRAGSEQEQDMLTSVNSFRAGLKIKEAAYLDSYKLLDTNGFIVYSTKPTEIGANEKGRSYFSNPLRDGKIYNSAVEFSPYDSKPYLYFSAIVKNRNHNIVGVFVVSYNANILQSMAKEYSHMEGAETYPILLDENDMRLADPSDDDMLFTTLQPLSEELGYRLSAAYRLPNAPISALSTNDLDFASKVSAMSATPFFITEAGDDNGADYGAAVRLTSQPWKLVFVENEAAVQNDIDNQTRLAVILTTLIAGAVSMLATYIAQSAFSAPISVLTHTAQQVTSGNLEARASLKNTDELGILANAFNTMTGQLQQFIASLEDRVRSRTSELAERNDALTFRARQLETIAEVARGVNQTQSLENLLTSVTTLISERFNFYHVGIFLVDESGKYAVLRAANSEGGQRMLARQHRLEIGQTGIVGYTTATGEARVATDVGQDAVFFNNSDLPLTRSEMALPLMAGERIIGALDVQSTESAAFTSEDIQLFKILADQVAMAIYNNQLYTETRQALNEAQRVHQRYLQQEWSRETALNRHSGYRYTPAGVQALQSSGESTVPQDDEPHTLDVPVKLRGETIGVIRIQDESSGGQWAEDEISTVEAVADQVALALENARLFTQTTRKAERERRVLEITSRIRSTNDPQVMMQIAVEELQKTLQASRAQIVLHPGGNGHHGPNGSNGHKPNQEPAD